MQVLYFMPAFREAMLAHVPSADKEFSLTGELALLFRMLHSAQSEACQVLLSTVAARICLFNAL